MAGTATPPRKRPRSTAKRPPRLSQARSLDADHLRSFTDLVGASASRADAALGDDAPDDAWATLAHTVDNLGSASLPARELAETRQQQGLPHQNEITGMPADVTVKTRLHVVSGRSLAWTRVRGQGEEYAALVGFVKGARETGPPRGSDAADRPSDALIEAKRRFYEALLHFRHPCAPLPSSVASKWQAVFAGAPQRDSEVRQLAMQRLTLWQQALQSLFYGYKYGYVDVFYVILSTTAVLFTRAHKDANHVNSQVNEDPRICFSKASPGLRQLLSEYMVNFRVVNAPGEDPCVVVEGDVDVHATYNCILSIGPKLSNANDVPVLLCDKPFRAGAPVSADVSSASEAMVSGAEETSRFSVQISGLLLPRQVRDICKAFQETQEKDFTMYMDTEERGNHLNICGHARDNDKQTGVMNGGGSLPHDNVLTGARVLSRVGISPSSETFSSAVTVTD